MRFSIPLGLSLFFMSLLSACGGGNEIPPRPIAQPNVVVEGDNVDDAEPAPFVPETDALFFGGMFGAPNASYTNPATNAQSCLAGYTEQKVSGTPYMDYFTSFCFKKPADGTNALYDFGGVYSANYNNPLTNAKSCPMGFSDKLTKGYADSSAVVDTTLNYCYRQRLPNVKPIAFFGGMFGYGGIPSNGLPSLYTNPATEDFTCPESYTKTLVYGGSYTTTFKGDYQIFICHKPVP